MYIIKGHLHVHSYCFQYAGEHYGGVIGGVVGAFLVIVIAGAGFILICLNFKRIETKRKLQYQLKDRVLRYCYVDCAFYILCLSALL